MVYFTFSRILWSLVFVSSFQWKKYINDNKKIILGVPKKCNDFTMSYLHKILNLTFWNFLQWFSMGSNSVLKDFMWSTQTIQTIQVFENLKIFGPVIIPKIMKIIVLIIKKCKRIFWKDSSNLWTQKLVATRRES